MPAPDSPSVDGDVRRPVPRVIAYLAPELPILSETFVYRELLALRVAGERIVPMSVHRPAWQPDVPELARLRDEVTVVYDRPLGIAGRAVLEALRHPIRTLSSLLRVGTDLASVEAGGIRPRLKVIAQAVGAIAAAGRARAAGTTHVHAQFAHVSATIAMVLAHQLGVPFSFTGHANDIFQRRSLLRAKLRRAAFTCCISEWHRDFYLDLEPAADPNRLVVIRCGVPSTYAGPQSVEDPGHLVTVARLVEKKGLHLAVEAMADPRIVTSGWRFRIIGDGPERARLEEAAAGLPHPDRVEFVGALGNADVLERLRAADVFVLPCIDDSSGDRDGIPVALMEAMAAGVPVVSGDLPAIRELIDDGRTGRLVGDPDSARVADAVAELIAAPDRRHALGAAGRDFVAEEFLVSVNAERFVAALDRLAAGD